MTTSNMGKGWSEYRGKSSDVKPISTPDNPVLPNSSFFEWDTDTLYFYDGDDNTWKRCGGGA